MSRDEKLRELEDRIRELCGRVSAAQGAEFRSAMLELANAIDLLCTANEEEDGKAAQV